LSRLAPFSRTARIRRVPSDRSVVEWLGAHAAPLDDLTSVYAAAHEATIVGLGESVHGTAEETMLKHRLLRLLVEQLEFRTITWKDDWTIGLASDPYISGAAATSSVD
jgi:erythromycin esterase-like protein